MVKRNDPHTRARVAPRTCTDPRGGASAVVASMVRGCELGAASVSNAVVAMRKERDRHGQVQAEATAGREEDRHGQATQASAPSLT